MRKAARWEASPSAPPTTTQLTREQMDDYAIESLRRAKDAIDNGGFKDEIVPVTIKSRAGETQVDTNEVAGRGRPDDFPQLKPAFAKGRDDHRGHLVVDLRRRRGRGPRRRIQCP